MLELVDGLQIAAVLVVDDDPDEVESVVDDLRQQGCAVTSCSSQEHASDLLSSGVAFDLVVLDWHLAEDSSIIAARVLTDILEYCFVPVAVWTRYFDEAQEQLDEQRYEYPSDMIIAVDKEVGAEGLRGQIIEWLDNNPQARLALLWSRSVRLSLAAPMRRLHELQGGELGSLAQYVWSKGFNRPRLAATALLELLQSLLTREVHDRPRFIETVVTILEPELGHSAGTSTERFSQLLSAQMYWVRPDARTIRTGDIIDTGGDPWEFAVLLTPACDLVRAEAESDHAFLARAWERCELYETRQMNSGARRDIVSYNKGRYHLLPFVPVDDGRMDLVVDFQEVQATLLESAQVKIQQEEAWRIVATVQSPYREHLTQRYLSFIGRVGTPDLPDHVQAHLRRFQ